MWDHCKLDLEAKGFIFHVRRDSDRRSQLAANLDDLVQMFDALDSTARIPPIYCEASDLLPLPPLSLYPVGVLLKNVVSRVDPQCWGVSWMPVRHLIW